MGIPQGVLNSLENYSERERLVELLDYWLKHHHSKPTWKEVNEAQRKAEFYELTNDPTHYSKFLALLLYITIILLHMLKLNYMVGYTLFAPQARAATLKCVSMCIQCCMLIT